MRVLFLGSPEFAVPSLKALLEDADFEVSAVITQPDRKAGRGQNLRLSAVKRHALEAGIPVFQFPKIRGNPEPMELLLRLQPEVMVVVAFGQILPSDFFQFPFHGTLNVHASLLPRYRGAAPIVHAILNGEKETGVTIMRIDEGMDTGDILSQRTVSISETCTAGELEAILSVEGASLLMETIGAYLAGELQPVPQESAGASYAPMIKREDGEVSWENDALSIHNRVRAMNPWPGAFSHFRDQKLKIWETEVAGPPQNMDVSSSVGSLVEAGKGSLVVQCGEGTYLQLLTLQLPNRKKVSARDFVNGNSVSVGERLD